MVIVPTFREIAGHKFDWNDTCVIGDCRRKFGDIAGVQPENIKQPGWAHSGDLSPLEYEEIIKERDRRWAAHHARDAA